MSETGEPFADYNELYGVTPAQIEEAANVPSLHLTALDALTESIDLDRKQAINSVEGAIEDPLNEQLLIPRKSGADLSANGWYMLGLLRMAALHAQTFDIEVLRLNTEYQSRVDERTYADHNQALVTLLVKPLGVIDVPAIREEVKAELLPQYTQARDLLEEGFAAVGDAMDGGIDLDKVATMIGLRLIPLSAQTHFPGLQLTDAQLFGLQYQVDMPNDIWRLLSTGDGWTEALGYDCLPYGMPTPRMLVPGEDLSDLPTGYYGGGFLEGPDGEKWPIVIPMVNIDGQSYLRTPGATYPVESLGGADPGWRTVGTKTGTTLFDEPTSTVEKALIFGSVLTGGTTGSVLTDGRRVDLLNALRIHPNGLPELTDSASEATPRGIPKGDPRSNPVDRNPFVPPGHVATPHSGNAVSPSGDTSVNMGQREIPGTGSRTGTVTGGGLKFLVDGAEGLNVISQIDDNDTHRYHVEFQENSDGRKRVILNTYDVMQGEDGSPHAQWHRSYIDSDGRLVQVPVNSHHPDGYSTVVPRR